MLEVFMGVILMCASEFPSDCQAVNAVNAFPNEDACWADIMTAGLTYITENYPEPWFVASADCMVVEVPGEPA